MTKPNPKRNTVQCIKNYITWIYKKNTRLRDIFDVFETLGIMLCFVDVLWSKKLNRFLKMLYCISCDLSLSHTLHLISVMITSLYFIFRPRKGGGSGKLLPICGGAFSDK